MPLSGKQRGQTSAPATMTVPIEGMTCASCVVRVEKALKRLEGVATVAVNLATEKATVEFDPSKVSFRTLQAAVKDSGYNLRLPASEEGSRSFPCRS